MTNSESEFVETAKNAVHRGATVLDNYVDSELGVRYKTPTDLVSDVDIEVEEQIIGFLQNRHPDHGVLAEESGEHGETEFRWLVDPIDGTTNYVNGLPHFAITVALERDREVIVGVTYCPPSDDLYVAVRGSGATLNGEPFTVSDEENLGESMVLIGSSPATISDQRFLALFQRLAAIEGGCQGVRRLGSGATDLGWTARGRADAYVDDYTSPWDVAAGTLLVEEAGGTVTDLRGAELDFQGGERQVQILATNGLIHDELVAAYQAVDA